MARPREFDKDLAVERATKVFWKKGYAATSTDDLIAAMQIGRQSMYNAFGDKYQLYVEVLKTYHQNVLSAHLARLNGPASALEGLRALLYGLAPDDEQLRALGCLGVGSVSEFGATNADAMKLAVSTSQSLSQNLVERVKEGQSNKEIDPSLNPEEVASYVQLVMTGIQVSARAGADVSVLNGMADFSIGRLKVASK